MTAKTIHTKGKTRGKGLWVLSRHRIVLYCNKIFVFLDYATSVYPHLFSFSCFLGLHLFLHSVYSINSVIVLAFWLFWLVSFSIFSQGVKEGWYDGGSIAFAVFLVIFVTGIGLMFIIVFWVRLLARINLKSTWSWFYSSSNFIYIFSIELAY